MTPIADMIAALPDRQFMREAFAEIRADLRLLAPRKVKPRRVRVSKGPRLRVGSRLRRILARVKRSPTPSPS